VLVMALGDGLAGLVGPLRPSPSWQVWGQRKSLLGTTTMAAASLAALALVAAAAPNAPGIGMVLLIALVATGLEQVAWLGLDNLTVPIVSAWLWSCWR
jgi:phytol kinase